MGAFTIYNKETGAILRSGFAPNGEEANQVQNNTEDIFIGQSYDDTKFRFNIETNCIEEYTPQLDIAELRKTVVRSIQFRLDEFAQSRGYDSILSATTYATSSNPEFANEGQKAVDLRDQTWTALYTLLSEIESGTRSIPSSYAEIEPFLPTLTWS